MPVFAASWLIGILLLKLLISNLGAVLGAALSVLSFLGSFLLGESMGVFIGSLIQLAVVCSLIWLAFRKMLGQNSIPVKWFEGFLRYSARQVPHVARWTFTTILKAIAGKGKEPGSSQNGRRD